jgi:hypothetical protein
MSDLQALPVRTMAKQSAGRRLSFCVAFLVTTCFFLSFLLLFLASLTKSKEIKFKLQICGLVRPLLIYMFTQLVNRKAHLRWRQAKSYSNVYAKKCPKSGKASNRNYIKKSRIITLFLCCLQEHRSKMVWSEGEWRWTINNLNWKAAVFLTSGVRRDHDVSPFLTFMACSIIQNQLVWRKSIVWSFDFALGQLWLIEFKVSVDTQRRDQVCQRLFCCSSMFAFSKAICWPNYFNISQAQQEPNNRIHERSLWRCIDDETPNTLTH